MVDARRRRFLSALVGDVVDRPPLWLMRQAGRYLPEYREVRKAHGFWEVCRTPELSTRVALEPLRKFPLDAAIVFSDILVIPDALGLGVKFEAGEGPRLQRRLASAADLDAWRVEGAAERLAFVSNAVRHLRDALAESVGIVGFAGAPFTLFAYCVEGGGSTDFMGARALLHSDPALAHRALAILADVASELLEAQCAAGADVVQLFDTWGGLLSAGDYLKFAVPAIRRISDAMRARGRKTILFVRGGTHLLPILDETGVDGFSLDWRVRWKDARAQLPDALLQGQLDPAILFAGEAAIRSATRSLLDEVRSDNGGKRAIINLGHGIHKDTPIEAVVALCQEVAAYG